MKIEIEKFYASNQNLTKLLTNDKVCLGDLYAYEGKPKSFSRVQIICVSKNIGVILAVNVDTGKVHEIEVAQLYLPVKIFFKLPFQVCFILAFTIITLQTGFKPIIPGNSMQTIRTRIFSWHPSPWSCLEENEHKTQALQNDDNQNGGGFLGPFPWRGFNNLRQFSDTQGDWKIQRNSRTSQSMTDQSSVLIYVSRTKLLILTFFIVQEKETTPTLNGFFCQDTSAKPSYPGSKIEFFPNNLF